MEKEDNKNYGSVTVVTLITLLASAGIIYLIVTMLIHILLCTILMRKLAIFR